MVGHKLGEFAPTRKRFSYRCVATNQLDQEQVESPTNTTMPRIGPSTPCSYLFLDVKTLDHAYMAW